MIKRLVDWLMLSLGLAAPVAAGPFGEFSSFVGPKHRPIFGRDKGALERLRDLLLGPLLAITQAVTDSFKKELMQAKHNFNLSGGNNFKMALYVAAATLGNSTTAYTSANEVSNSGTAYTTTGSALTRIDPTNTGNVAFTDFADVTWGAATITARGSLIYNVDQANAAVLVLDFGADKTSTSGNFTVVFPAADSSNAILRIGP